MSKAHFTFTALFCACALAACMAAANAATLQFSFTGNGAGSLAGEHFGASAFVITGQADTSNSAQCAVDDCRYLDFASARVSIEGLGDFPVLSVLRVYNTLGHLGLSRGGPAGLDLFNAFPVAVDYDFSLALGPIAAVASLLQWRDEDVLTSAGVLAFDDGDSDGTFRAEGVPLPASAWLLASAMFAGAMRRRRAV